MYDFLTDTSWVSLFWVFFGTIGTIVALLSFPALRRRFLIACGLIGVVVAIWLGVGRFLDHRQNLAQTEREAKRKNLVKPSDLEFIDLKMGLLCPSCSSWSLSGRMKNNSQYRVDSIRIRILLRDCVDSSCEVIAEKEESILYESMPPGQTRDTFVSIDFGRKIEIRGRFEWRYEVVSIQADDA